MKRVNTNAWSKCAVVGVKNCSQTPLDSKAFILLHIMQLRCSAGSQIPHCHHRVTWKILGDSRLDLFTTKGGAYLKYYAWIREHLRERPLIRGRLLFEEIRYISSIQEQTHGLSQKCYVWNWMKFAVSQHAGLPYSGQQRVDVPVISGSTELWWPTLKFEVRLPGRAGMFRSSATFLYFQPVREEALLHTSPLWAVDHSQHCRILLL